MQKYGGNKIMNISVRGLDAAVVKKIDELARKNKVSREEYIRRYLTKVSELEDIQNIDEKYHNLVDAVVDRLEQANDIIESNTLALEKISEKLK